MIVPDIIWSQIGEYPQTVKEQEFLKCGKEIAQKPQK